MRKLKKNQKTDNDKESESEQIQSAIDYMRDSLREELDKKNK